MFSMDGQLSNQPNDSIMLLSVMWSEFSVAAVILTARILTRTLVISSWGWDDMSICLSMVFLLYLAGEIEGEGRKRVERLILTIF